MHVPSMVLLPLLASKARVFRAGSHKAQRQRRRRHHRMQSTLMLADPECRRLRQPDAVLA